MKFTEHLSAHITPEWRKQYIQYEAFKEMLYSAQDQAPSVEVTDEDTVKRYYAKFEEKFFQTCEKELAKINTFYSEKLAEAQRRFATLQNELQSSLDAQRESSRAPGLRSRARRRPVFHLSQQERCKHRNIKDLQLAFSEFYLSLILLQNYQNLNFTGFRKILKKHDKIFETARGADWRVIHVEVAPFYTCKKITQLISETEALVTAELEGGDRQKAMKRLRVPPLGAAQPAPAWTTFRVGLYCGVFIVLLVTITITGAVSAVKFGAVKFGTVKFGADKSAVWPLVRIYRGGFLLIEFLFLLGINTYGWRQAGVNHVLIFELNPRNNLSHQHLFEIAGFLGVLWCVSILSCLFSEAIMIPIWANPLALYGFFMLFLINPFKTCYYKSRFWLLKLLFRVVTAPFHKVEFADFWLADQLNSLAVLLMDLEYLVCFYSLEINWTPSYEISNGICNSYSYGVRAVIQCLPAWFRFVQCLRRYRDTRRAFPHLVNAGKYSTTFFVVTFAALYNTHKVRKDNASEADIFFYLLIAFSVINSCYTLVWDLKMDWGLFDRNAGENALLREEIVYPQKAYYYCAILENVILRFAWTIPITVRATYHVDIADILATVLAPLEVFRRFVWNFFRLENEHLNNCGEFRAVRDISVAPLNADDQTLLEQMMDQEDGVRNRQGKKSWKRSYSMSLRRPRLASQSKIRDTKVLIEDTDDDT
ncbi:xenotropic and polytropic retrovirus receptor 1 homolog [Electrophorus electricus]|uniref:Xenotropic and polytropic retrovirus receptor 1 n=1 Tax=Electrophorus electricus TaxID=8005 RepID=A0A4W4GLL8_ELEEL|nr:xenotropic and polytropic retrovirus receptor 1 homolog [Electrophorus electricus]